MSGFSVVQRLAIAVAVVFLALGCWAAFTPVHVGNSSCGNWLAPELTDAKVRDQITRAQQVIDQSGGLIDTSELEGATRRLVEVKLQCDDKLDTRQTLTWWFLAAAVAAPVGVLFVGSGFGRRTTPAP